MAKLADLSGLDDAGDDSVEVEILTEAIDLIRGEGQFEWADDTLQGIYDTIKKQEFVTVRQRQAIENIIRTKGKELEDYF